MGNVVSSGRWALAIAAMLLVHSTAFAQDAGLPPPQAQSGSGPPPARAVTPSHQETLIAAEAPHASAPRSETPVTLEPGQARPSSGTAQLITGGIFLGLGLLDFATAPICVSSIVPASRQSACLDIDLGFAGGATGIGALLLIFGGIDRGEYNDWKSKHSPAAEALTHFTIQPAARGASGGFVTTF